MASEQPVDTGNVEILHAAVEAFRKRELGYREILEDLPAAIYTTDSDGRITYFNRACIDFAGRTPTLGEDRWCIACKLFTVDGQPLPEVQFPATMALRIAHQVTGLRAIAERPDGSMIRFEHFATPIFDDRGDCLGTVNMLVDITAQSKAQERLELLAREIDHRSNNLLTLVQSLIRLTKAETVIDYKEILQGRVMALARANSLISDKRWDAIDLQSLVHEELAAFSDRRIAIRGEPIAIRTGSAQSIAMIVHELCTNAVKHGALSSKSGKVGICWTVDDASDLVLTWEETGGPPVQAPVVQNTGNRVIDAVVRQLGGTLTRDWDREGLRCTLICSTGKL
jgi:two-component sensor histidine kinase